jgi:hypothetical protein
MLCETRGGGLVGSRGDLLRGNTYDSQLGIYQGAEINRPPCDQVDRGFCVKHCCCWHGDKQSGWCACECFPPAGPDGVKRCAWTYDEIRDRAMKDAMEARG